MDRKPLNNIGYEYDIDFSSMSDEDIKYFGRQIVKDNVILVRNQTINEERLLYILEQIGNVLKPNQFFMHPDYPGLFRVTNERKEGEKIGIFADKELDWHSNGNGRKSGTEACVMLYCLKPGENSVTSFCDTRQAYNDLSNEDKHFYNEIDCTFKFENNTFYHLEEDDKELVMFKGGARAFKYGVKKPLVYEHPYTKEKGLYFTFHYIRDMWKRIIDGDEDHEDVNMEEHMAKLKKHIFQDKYMYHHDDWRPGDLIFMDQFHSIHKRNAVEGDRFLYRASFGYENCQL
jgi:alpha-ketoglutarate-dependent taurine dioxygenase